MKKVISVFFALTLVLAASAAACAQDGATALLSGLNIMVGDENGDFRLDDYVSRAEFAKIAVTSSKSKNTVAAGANVSPFKDVPYTHWSAPYVRAAASAGIVSGYIDATFRPDNTVSYEEALTMILKVLGYTDEDFGYSWPYGQIGLADSLEITDNVGASIGDALTRRQVAELVYNALNTKMKDSAEKLMSVFDCRLEEGVTIIATNREDSSLGADKIYTTAGTFAFDGEFNEDYVGRRGDMAVKNGEDFLSFTPREQIVEDYTVSNVIGSDLILDGNMYSINSNTVTYYKTDTMTYENAATKASKGDTFRLFKNENGSVDYALLISGANNAAPDAFDKYVIYSQLSDAVIGYRNGSFEQIDVDDGTTCYDGNQKSTYAAVKNQMAMGDILYVKKNGDAVDYVSFEKGNMQGPVRIRQNGILSGLPVDNSAAVMRDGVKASASELREDDIVYYSEDLNMVMAYTDKVTGVYEKASPTKDAPTSVTVSGVDYDVESVEAFNDLSSNGAFKYGDTVTLLLGRYGSVAGVSDNTRNSVTGGYVTEAGKKDFYNTDNSVYSSYYAKVVSADGTVNEYATSGDASMFVCSAVRISFKDGKASFTRANTSGGVYGKVSASRGTIGSFKLASDVKILDTTSGAYGDIPAYCRIYPQRIDALTLGESNIIYSSKNAAGEIDELILSNVTGDMYSYGIVTRANSQTGEYTIDVDGKQNVYMTSFSSSALGPHKLKLTASGIDYMVQLTAYPQSVKELTRTEALIGNQKYLLSDKVVVYRRMSGGSYLKITLDDAINGNYTLTAYYDKAQTSGGRIRIITAQ